MYKVMFVNYCDFEEVSATGNTLKNIFYPMKNVEILQLVLNPICSNYIFPNGKTLPINKKDSWSNFLINSIHKKNKGVPLYDKKKSLIQSIKHQLKSEALAFSGFQKIKFRSFELEEIKQFKPDVIYTIGGTSSVLDVCLRFSRKFKIPVVLHNMDDIYNYGFQQRGLFSIMERHKIRELIKQVYNRSFESIAISEKMAFEYSKYFKIPFSVAMNSVECKIQEINTTENLSFVGKLNFFCNNSLRLIFSGGLHGGRKLTIIKFVNCIQEYNSQHDVKYQLDVYTNVKYIDDILLNLQSEFFHIHEYVPIEQYYNNLRRHDILLHVESFNISDIKYFRFSMSTKIPEYCSVGRPILGIGPADIATIEYIDLHQLGWCINNFDMVNQKLEEITSDFQKNERLFAINCLKLATTSFSKKATTLRVYNTIMENIKLNTEQGAKRKLP